MSVNLNVFTCGGGVFSYFHQFIRNMNINEIPFYNQVRLMVIPSGYVKNVEIFDNVFQYDNIESFTPTSFDYIPNTYNLYSRANLFSGYPIIKQLCSKMKFQSIILNEVSTFVETYGINVNTLGVHVRLTDMNITHPENGVFTINDYIQEIKNYLTENPTTSSIFIASDNNESIKKIRNEFPSHTILSFDNKYRIEKADDDNLQNQIDNLNNPEFYQQNVIEALILSKCGALIHRISDFANFAILFSTTFKDIRCLHVQ